MSIEALTTQEQIRANFQVGKTMGEALMVITPEDLQPALEEGVARLFADSMDTPTQAHYQGLWQAVGKRPLCHYTYYRKAEER